MLNKDCKKKLKDFLISNLISRKKFKDQQLKVKKALIEDQKKVLSEKDKKIIQKYPDHITYMVGEINVVRSILGMSTWDINYASSDNLSKIQFDLQDKFYQFDDYYLDLSKTSWSKNVFEEIEKFRNVSREFEYDIHKVETFIEDPGLTKEFVEKWIMKF